MGETGMGAGMGYSARLQGCDPVQPGDAWRRSSGSSRTLRYVSLLYTCFFLIEPYQRHSRVHWLWFGAFYVVFLGLFFANVKTEGRLQKVLLALMLVLSYAYFPYNESACGAFVYPTVIMAFLVRRTSTYIAIVLSVVAGILLETWYFNLHWWTGLMGMFFCIVIGFSSLAASRQQQATFMLQRANEEIEHLAQVAERERIARDLHDLLGHTLTVIAIKSELANRLMDRDPARARQEMLDVEQTARKALVEVREAVVGYRSEGFPAEVLRARRTLDSAGITLASSVAAAELTPAETNVLCLCLREAVTNIVRHAQATTCDVQLMHHDAGLTLKIDDNGAGSQRGEGNGLRGMRERVEGLQGRMRFTSATNAGTQITVELPAKLPRSIPVAATQEVNA